MMARASVTENGADATTHEDRDGERIGERTDRADLVGDARLIADDEDTRAANEATSSASAAALSKERIQAMVIRGVITLLCGVGLYASLFMLNKSRRAARGEDRRAKRRKNPEGAPFRRT